MLLIRLLKIVFSVNQGIKRKFDKRNGSQFTVRKRSNADNFILIILVFHTLSGQRRWPVGSRIDPRRFLLFVINEKDATIWSSLESK
jgi:hypothetical protein